MTIKYWRSILSKPDLNLNLLIFDCYEGHNPYMCLYRDPILPCKWDLKEGEVNAAQISLNSTLQDLETEIMAWIFVMPMVQSYLQLKLDLDSWQDTQTA